MSSREEILARLRKNTRETYDMPDLSEIHPIVFADPVEQFIKKATTTAGAKVIEMKADDKIDEIVRSAYPEANIIASNVVGVTAQLNPDTVATVQELATADVGVIHGTIGVAENACIWIPQTMKEKAVCFASEYLVVCSARSASSAACFSSISSGTGKAYSTSTPMSSSLSPAYSA